MNHSPILQIYIYLQYIVLKTQCIEGTWRFTLRRKGSI